MNAAKGKVFRRIAIQSNEKRRKKYLSSNPIIYNDREICPDVDINLYHRFFGSKSNCTYFQNFQMISSFFLDIFLIESSRTCFQIPDLNISSGKKSILNFFIFFLIVNHSTVRGRSRPKKRFPDSFGYKKVIKVGLL